MRRKFNLALLTLVLFSGAAQGSPENSSIKTLIITGQADLPSHIWQETTESIRSILEKSGRFDLRVVEEPRGINRVALEGYDVLILNYNGPRWPREAEEAVEDFVRKGGGLFAFHQASYGYFFGQVKSANGWKMGKSGTDWAEFSKMIGARWAPENIGHARRTVFEVDWIDTGHPISSGLPKSFMANDELYHKLELAPQVNVLADALSPVDLGGTGKREPLVWTNLYGKGRVFFTVLGHDTLAWHESGMANLLSRGTEWASTGDVTIPPVKRGHRQIQDNDIRLLVVTGGHDYPMEFYSMLDSLPHVIWSHATSHDEAFSAPIQDSFDAVLLHDMIEKTTENTRTRLKDFFDVGGGIISLHHAIVDYTDWPWWYQKVTGGKYFTEPKDGHPASQFKEGVEFLVTPVRGKENHPVLRGVGSSWVHDELYKGMVHSPDIEVLMETADPDNDPPIVYIGPNSKARILYIQLGHSSDTMENPGFRKLMANAISWGARK